MRYAFLQGSICNAVIVSKLAASTKNDKVCSIDQELRDQELSSELVHDTANLQ